jgi:hypothetical protein
VIPPQVFRAMLHASWAIAIVAVFAGLAVALTRCGGDVGLPNDDGGTKEDVELCPCTTCGTVVMVPCDGGAD